MKTKNIYIENLKREIIFYIGTNKDENFNVIDIGKPEDLWFHANNISSCHIVCEIPTDKIDKKDLKTIIKIGALLCKQNTNKLKSIKNVEIIYTQIKNVFKTDIKGCVTTSNTKSIFC